MRNKNKYLFIRMINMIKGFLIFPIFIFFPKIKKRIIFSSTGNINYNFNSQYLFEYFLKNYPSYEVKFVINDSKEKEKLKQQFGDHFIDTNSIKGIFYSLRAYTWVCSSLETPVGGFFLRINRLVIHLGHGTPLKNIGFLEKNIGILKFVYYSIIKNNFSYILSTSHEFDLIMSKFLKVPTKRILTNGQPRTDIIFEDKKEFLKKGFLIDEKDKNILYAPTWRQKKDTLLFPFKDMELKELKNYLIENKINIFLRVHPDFEKEIDKTLLELDRIHCFNGSIAKDISEYLSCFDLLITDYSSIFIDYLLLLRPIMFIPYDYEEYNQEIGFTVDYLKHTPGPKVLSFESFKVELKKLLNDENYFSDERKKENSFYNIYEDNKNCERIANFIIENITK